MPILIALLLTACAPTGHTHTTKPTPTTEPRITIHDSRCYDSNGNYDSDLGADDLDCANQDETQWPLGQ